MLFFNFTDYENSLKTSTPPTFNKLYNESTDLNFRPDSELIRELISMIPLDTLISLLKHPKMSFTNTKKQTY